MKGISFSKKDGTFRIDWSLMRAGHHPPHKISPWGVGIGESDMARLVAEAGARLDGLRGVLVVCGSPDFDVEVRVEDRLKQEERQGIWLHLVDPARWEVTIDDDE